MEYLRPTQFDYRTKGQVLGRAVNAFQSFAALLGILDNCHGSGAVFLLCFGKISSDSGSGTRAGRGRQFFSDDCAGTRRNAGGTS
jgi:hypothetical protein